MDSNFDPDITPDNPFKYSKASAKYRAGESTENKEEGITEGYYSKSKRLPMHTEADVSAINDASYQVS